MKDYLVLVGIGASLTGSDGTAPIETCRRAAVALDHLPGLRLRALSRWWESDPIPPLAGAPPFINSVARLEGWADPAALLASLHAIEDLAGRLRPFPNAPRTLDLDLIAMGGVARDAPAPVLPHPRMHDRAFVLYPLAEVAPDWRHPRLGLSVGEMIASLPHQGLRPLG